MGQKAFLFCSFLPFFVTLGGILKFKVEIGIYVLFFGGDDDGCDSICE
jgi:hypothetical protein